MSEPMEPTRGGVAIVLSGAGARGAYEAGALSVLLPLLKGEDRPRLVLGASAGALNAAMLVSYLDRGVEAAAAAMLTGWRQITPSMIFATPRRSILQLAPFRRRPAGEAPGLLDTSPLRTTLGVLLPDERFASAVERQTLDAVAISASSVAAGDAVVFVETRTLRIPESGDGIEYVSVELGFDHLMASSAFPLAFPSRWVNGAGEGWYIDGGVHLNTPLKPALELGAERILAVGATPWGIGLKPDVSNPPNVMDGSAQILHSLLVDSFRSDLATLARTNRQLREAPTRGAQRSAAAPQQRVVEFCVLNPRTDELSKVAAGVWPSGVLPFLRSLGGYGALGLLTSQHQLPGQFLSYLCFAPEFISAAIDAGIADAKELVQRSGGGIPWATEQPPAAP